MIRITGNSFDRGAQAISEWSEEKDIAYNINYIVFDYGVKTVKFDSHGYFKPGSSTVKSIQLGDNKTGLKLTGNFTGTVTSNEATFAGIISSFKEWSSEGSIEVKGNFEFSQTTTIDTITTHAFNQGKITEAVIKGTPSGVNVTITGLNISMEEWESSYPQEFFAQILDDDNYYVIQTPLINDIVELAEGGTDTAESQLTYTLPSNVEKLVLAGKKAINGTGNELDNHITGNSAANTLTGGVGNDSMAGMSGNDSLDGGIGNDEIWGGGVDWDGIFIKSGNDTLSGGDGSDYIYGGDGNDLINGGIGNDYLEGELGNDTVIGGEGHDTLHDGGGKDVLTGGIGDDGFVIHFDLVSKSAVTTVTDFNKLGTDIIYLFTDNTLYLPNSEIYDGLFEHEVTASEFYAGSGFKNANTLGQYYGYDTKTGTLYYDKDSVGGKAAVAICVLTGIPTLSASDIIVTND